MWVHRIESLGNVMSILLISIFTLILSSSVRADSVAHDVFWRQFSQATGPDGWVNAIVDFGGTLVIGGYFDSTGGVETSKLSQWNGLSWQPVDPAGGPTPGVVSALTVLNGKLIVARGNSALRIVAGWDGSTWSIFGGDMGGGVNALCVYNGELFAGGRFTFPSDTTITAIARWDGSEWKPVGGGIYLPGGKGEVTALTAFNGMLAVGGKFSRAGDLIVRNIVLWNGSAWSSPGSGVGGAINALTIFGTQLVVGGTFTEAGGNPVNHIADWDGLAWKALATGMDGTVSELAVYDGKVYAAGIFQFGGSMPANSIAAWDGTNWSALGSGVNSLPLSLCSVGNELYVGGLFTGAGGRPTSYLASWTRNASTCCLGATGNVDCDPAEGVDISDLSALIDYLYITFAPLCCVKEANVDGSIDDNIDISDLSALIDYLYINFTPPAACQ